jgi:phosphatidylglycerol:prolipoprotein diacylglycerol transferase
VRQTLFTIPHEVLGITVFGFGWALMVWGIVCVIAIVWLVRRQGWNSDTGSFVLFLLAIGGVIAFGLPIVEAAQHDFAAPPDAAPKGLPIRGYGLMLLIAVASGVGLAGWRARRMGVSPEVIYSLAFWMFVFGILGARAFYVIEYWDEFQRPTPKETLLAVINVTQGGLVVYGSVIGGVAAGAVFLVRHKIPVLAIADVVAPSMVLGLALGRIGCFLNGCCFGGVCELPWAVQFPARSPPYFRQHQLGQLHGFQIAESESGGAVVGAVDPDGPAANAGLRTGDPIAAIQLSPDTALQAAGATPAFAGETIAVILVSGEERRLPIPEWDNAVRMSGAARLGIELIPVAQGPSPILQITAGSPADTAGLKAGDRIAEVRLPPTPSAALARDVMQWAGSRVALDTDRGRIAWTQEGLPRRSLPIHPAQIYSAINAFVIFFFLWVYYPFRTRDGEIFAWMITIYPVTRILEEIIRTDEPPQFGTGLSISQLVSLGILLAAAGLWLYLYCRAPGSVLPYRAPQAERESLLSAAK